MTRETDIITYIDGETRYLTAAEFDGIMARVKAVAERAAALKRQRWHDAMRGDSQ